jgi:thioredoxin 1
MIRKGGYDMAVVLTTGNFEEEVYQADMPVLVDFYADWCGPCKAMGPVVETLAQEYEGRVKVGKVNVDENQELAAKYNVMSIPTFLVLKGQDVIARTMGVQDKSSLVTAIESAF